MTEGWTVSHSLDFACQVNDSVLPASKPVQVTAPASAAAGTVVVQALSTPQVWLTVTPGAGRPPLRASWLPQAA